MKLGLVANFKKPGVGDFIVRLRQKAEALGCELLVPDRYSSKFPYQAPFTFLPQEEMLRQADLLVIVGGDGTILHDAKLAAPQQLPVLGFNFGRKGFLTTLAPEELDRLEEIIAGEFRVEKRLMLEASFQEQDGEFVRERRLLCVNDFVIGREFSSKMSDMEIAIDGKRLGSYRADSLIFSTPTGSTAYNLAAGGPVLEPNQNSILLTPICPFSAHSQSVVLPGDSLLAVQLHSAPGAKCTLVADGHQPVALNNNSIIRISKSDLVFRLVRMPEQSFYDICRKKLWQED